MSLDKPSHSADQVHTLKEARLLRESANEILHDLRGTGIVASSIKASSAVEHLGFPHSKKLLSDIDENPSHSRGRENSQLPQSKLVPERGQRLQENDGVPSARGKSDSDSQPYTKEESIKLADGRTARVSIRRGAEVGVKRSDGSGVILNGPAKTYFDPNVLTVTDTHGNETRYIKGAMADKPGYGALWKERWTSDQTNPKEALANVDYLGAGTFSYDRYALHTITDPRAPAGIIVMPTRMDTVTLLPDGTSKLSYKDTDAHYTRRLELDKDGRISKVKLPDGADMKLTYKPGTPDIDKVTREKIGRSPQTIYDSEKDKGAEISKKNGELSVTRADGSKDIFKPDGEQLAYRPDGKLVKRILPDGTFRNIEWAQDGKPSNIIDGKRTADGKEQITGLMRREGDNVYVPSKPNKPGEKSAKRELNPHTHPDGINHKDGSFDFKLDGRALVSQLDKISPEFQAKGQRERARMDLLTAAKGTHSKYPDTLKKDMDDFERRMSQTSSSTPAQQKETGTKINQVYESLTKALTDPTVLLKLSNADREKFVSDLLHNIAHPDTIASGKDDSNGRLREIEQWTARQHPDAYANQLCEILKWTNYEAKDPGKPGHSKIVNIHPEALKLDNQLKGNLASDTFKAALRTFVDSSYPATIASPISASSVEQAAEWFTGKKHRK